MCDTSDTLYFYHSIMFIMIYHVYSWAVLVFHRQYGIHAEYCGITKLLWYEQIVSKKYFQIVPKDFYCNNEQMVPKDYLILLNTNTILYCDTFKLLNDITTKSESKPFCYYELHIFYPSWHPFYSKLAKVCDKSKCTLGNWLWVGTCLNMKC